MGLVLRVSKQEGMSIFLHLPSSPILATFSNHPTRSHLSSLSPSAVMQIHGIAHAATNQLPIWDVVLEHQSGDSGHMTTLQLSLNRRLPCRLGCAMALHHGLNSAATSWSSNHHPPPTAHRLLRLALDQSLVSQQGQTRLTAPS